MTEDVPATVQAAPKTRFDLQKHHRLVFAPALAVLTVLAIVLQRDLLAIVVVAVLMLGALADPMLGERPPWTQGLPGVPDGPPPASRVPPVVYLVSSAVVVVATAVLVLADAPGWAFVVLAVLAALALLVSAESAWRYALHARRVRRGLRAYTPTTAMGYAGRSGGPWQLRMWEPYVLRSGERNVVINLHEKYARMILKDAGLTSPYVQLGSRGFKDLDDVLVPSLKAVFYVQNARANAGFMEHTRLTHVWLNHGDSDKPANFNPRHALYDVLVVCGQAGIDRYAKHGIHVDPEKFVILGRPQASGVKPAYGRIADKDPKVVLYAPTWQGLEDAVNFSSLERGPEIVRALIERDVTVVFRPHPLSYRWRIRRAVVQEIREILQQDKATSDRKHLWGRTVDKKWTVANCANRSHALISDVSSVVSDFLQSQKPYAMTSMRASVDDFRAEFSVAETGYVLLGDLSNLDEVLDDLLVADPLAAARAERKRYVLGDFVGEESADAFADFVKGLVRGS
ncbi:CDP-glycerol glycerophosphotransferase family protein [Aeromicrobium stalagmiti]|uniref:CDP-glycerol glycerophosphotransferase family protein n=1 Tax=Aeromicrobium stalagmiti TaxID=2738988 RepID=UPI001568050E|nr:CDP-glycerol glycerophosphotransferase family protein [Aeromicrobium stalagmiti]